MNKDMILRLAQYKRVLHKLKSLGFVKVFSDNLGDALGVSSALVRKDFSAFGLTGHKRGGYHIEDLLNRIQGILGGGDIQKVVLVGFGKIGMALMHYQGFRREGIRVVAAFDVKAELFNAEAPVPVYDVTQLAGYIKKEKIQMAIMAVPENAVSHVRDILVSNGIKGILNFAPVALKNTSTCIINNINIAQEIENLIYFVRFAEKGDFEPGTS